MHGRGEEWLPLAIGVVALLMLTIGHVAGWGGLYTHQVVNGDAALPGIGTRLIELFRNLVLLLFWSGCGVAALFAASIVLNRAFGDARLAVVRIAGILITIRLATLLAIGGPLWVEWSVELILQAVGFILLAMFFFALEVRNAVILALLTLMAILLLWLFTYAVQWALVV